MPEKKKPLHETLLPGQEVTAPEVRRGVCYQCGKPGFGEVVKHGQLECAGCKAKLAEASEEGRAEYDARQEEVRKEQEAAIQKWGACPPCSTERPGDSSAAPISDMGSYDLAPTDNVRCGGCGWPLGTMTVEEWKERCKPVPPEEVLRVGKTPPPPFAALHGQIRQLVEDGVTANGPALQSELLRELIEYEPAPDCFISLIPGQPTMPITVTCGEANNPPESLAKGELQVYIKATEPTADDIVERRVRATVELSEVHPADLQKDLAVIAKASPGPWGMEPTTTANSHYACGSGPWHLAASSDPAVLSDAAFIARARSRWPALVSSVVKHQTAMANLASRHTQWAEMESCTPAARQLLRQVVKDYNELSYNLDQGEGVEFVDGLGGQLLEANGTAKRLLDERDSLRMKVAALEARLAEMEKSHE